MSIELQHFYKKFKIEGIEPDCITNEIIQQSISNEKDNPNNNNIGDEKQDDEKE